MKTLVIGGTGTVGSQVVLELLRRNQAVRVLVTSPDKAAQLPSGVEAHVGNLEQPATLPEAFQDVDRVFLLNQHTQTEMAQGMYAVAAAHRAGVHKLVYQSIHNVRQGAHIPHFRSKIAIEKAIMHTGLNYTFICPNNFYQLDFLFAEPIINYGLYAQPMGNVGLNRVDVRDIAEAAVTALLSDEWNGQSIPLVGPEALTGQQTAQLLSEQLASDVTYAGDDLDSWATQMKQWFAGWLVDDWVEMYRFFQTRGLLASSDDLTLTSKLLGRAPRCYADFVADYAQVFRPALELV